MNMVTFLFAPSNVPFAAALLLMCMLGALETAALAVGISFSDAGGLDVDADLDGIADFAEHGALSGALGWLRIGRVPLLIWLVIFLSCFGVVGLALQAAVRTVSGSMLPVWPATGLALAGTLPPVRSLSGLAAKVLPRDESSAVSVESFVGRVATVTTGIARIGAPAQGRLRDQHGQTHYVMIEPDVGNDAFEEGSAVLLVRTEGAIFKGIRNPSSSLTDHQ